MISRSSQSVAGAEGVQEAARVAGPERDAQDVGGVQQGCRLLEGQPLGHGRGTYASCGRPLPSAARARSRRSSIDADRAWSADEVWDTADRIAHLARAATAPPPGQGRAAGGGVRRERRPESRIAHLGGLRSGASVVADQQPPRRGRGGLPARGRRRRPRDRRTRHRRTGPGRGRAGRPVRGAGRGATRTGTRWLAAAPAGPPPDDVPIVPNLLFTSGTTGTPEGHPPAAQRVPACGRSWAEFVEATLANRFVGLGRHLVVAPAAPHRPAQRRAGPRRRHPDRRAPPVRRRAPRSRRSSAGRSASTTARAHPPGPAARPARRATAAQHDVSSLQLVFLTGAACPVDVKRAIIEWWGPVVLEAYGATEVGVTTLDHQRRTGSPTPARSAARWRPTRRSWSTRPAPSCPPGTGGPPLLPRRHRPRHRLRGRPRADRRRAPLPRRLHAGRDRHRRRRRLGVDHRPLLRHGRDRRGQRVPGRDGAGPRRPPRRGRRGRHRPPPPRPRRAARRPGGAGRPRRAAADRRAPGAGARSGFALQVPARDPPRRRPRTATPSASSTSAPCGSERSEHRPSDRIGGVRTIRGGPMGSTYANVTVVGAGIDEVAGRPRRDRCAPRRQRPRRGRVLAPRRGRGDGRRRSPPLRLSEVLEVPVVDVRRLRRRLRCTSRCSSAARWRPTPWRRPPASRSWAR